MKKIKTGYQLFGKSEVKLLKLYQIVEKKIVDRIIKLNKDGKVDFSNIVNDSDINRDLNKFIDYTRELAPKMVEEQFLLGRRKAGLVGKKVPEMYHNALDVLSEQIEGKTINSKTLIKNILQKKWRQCLFNNKNDIDKASEEFVNNVKNKGITSFVDRTGKNWSVKSYFSMASRTMALQATNLGSLSEDWDLYKMSSHPTSCPICKPLQGRVYSKSGLNKKYPPLASIFGKIDPNGPDVLENTYLCIHPNCQHKLTKFKESKLSFKEIKEMQQRSSFKTNPPNIPKKSQKEIKEYRKNVNYERALKKSYNAFLNQQVKNLNKSINFNVKLA